MIDNATMELDLDEIINILARKHPRRMVLSDVLGRLYSHVYTVESREYAPLRVNAPSHFFCKSSCIGYFFFANTPPPPLWL